MTFQSFPHTSATSPFGEVEVWATSERHIGVSANGPINVEPRQTLVINGVEVTARIDFAPTADVLAGRESWQARDAEGKAWAVQSQFLMRRVDNYKEASEAARRKFRAWALVWVNEFVMTPEGQALLARAQGAKDNNEADSLRSDIAELEGKLAEKRARLAELEAVTV